MGNATDIPSGDGTNAWVPFGGGGSVGSEGGKILKDEEIIGSCRITLEEGGHIAPYAITCGVYGFMVHTVYAGTYEEAARKYQGMRGQLRECAGMLGDDGFRFGEWARHFVDEW